MKPWQNLQTLYSKEDIKWIIIHYGSLQMECRGNRDWDLLAHDHTKQELSREPHQARAMNAEESIGYEIVLNERGQVNQGYLL